MNLIFNTYCTIRRDHVWINGRETFKATPGSEKDFLKQLYQHLQLDYPKFYKMDNLCQLAFIASDLLLKDNKATERYRPEEISIVISNSSASLEIDTEHQGTISDKDNYFPSPAVFVYTLPNILIGEIAIRNLIKGENTFFIFDKFDVSGDGILQPYEVTHILKLISDKVTQREVDALIAYLDVDGDGDIVVAYSDHLQFYSPKQ